MTSQATFTILRELKRSTCGQTQKLPTIFGQFVRVRNYGWLKQELIGRESLCQRA